MFKGKSFMFIGLAGGEKSKLVEMIEEEEGEIHKSIKNDTSYLIATEKAVKESGATVQSAFEKSVPVVKDSFITDCVDQSKLLSADSYTFDKDGNVGKSSAAASSSDDDNKKKRKKGEDDEDEEEEANEEKKVEPATKKKKILSTGKVPVDEESGMQTSGKVLVEGKDIWSATLNQTNASANNNKFYIIQLIESGSKYYVFNRWGRVGAKGQNKLTSFGSLDKAKADFKKKFKEKTTNTWENRANFKFVKGKYDLVELDYDDDQDEAKEDDEEMTDDQDKPVPDSKLPKRVQDLIKFISNKTFINELLKEYEIDTNKLPLGKLSKNQVQKGYEILKKIQDVIDGKNKSDDLESLSSRFFTLIPHDFGRRNPPVINQKTMLQKKIELVESLAELEVASKIISKEKKTENPIDSIYNDLHTELTPVEKNSEEWKWIDKFIQNTHAPTHSSYTLELQDAFVVKREGEAEKYIEKSKDISNKQLLFHGSRSTNFIGILSQGLRIAPPEAPATGYMFGKGVYFADMCSKSANYCHSHLSDNCGLLLLTEVALGATYNKTQSEFVTKLPGSLGSTWGQGQCEPNGSEYLEIDSTCSGQKVKVPYGKPVQTNRHSSLLYNEYIIYDTAQANLRYLIKCKFHNKY
ncbi:hypothetical protein C9374_008422 [Naegleria lovaniensis]|uniref:Poly [ADP-ribose] polymerase n=1 Tax=Naegleria lovaniensis TaxID=51637 RepID=A0AA88GF83_NAELO|nr:uncharacterized protein C9374_008422 [Naegleria lovaniensis]KAG2378279.1 hypothetical protein C9374_008422 [Naegleria lovaniensis]